TAHPAATSASRTGRCRASTPSTLASERDADGRTSALRRLRRRGRRPRHPQAAPGRPPAPTALLGLRLPASAPRVDLAQDAAGRVAVAEEIPDLHRDAGLVLADLL